MVMMLRWMPRQTGADMYRDLVRDRLLGQTPVIVLSAVPEKINLVVQQAAAVFDKPIDAERFLREVDRILGQEEG